MPARTGSKRQPANDDQILVQEPLLTIDHSGTLDESVRLVDPTARWTLHPFRSRRSNSNGCGRPMRIERKVAWPGFSK